MGQRTQSLTLAGIMFLSVLAGMLMFDLDSTTEEPPNIKPSIAGASDGFRYSIPLKLPSPTVSRQPARGAARRTAVRISALGVKRSPP